MEGLDLTRLPALPTWLLVLLMLLNLFREQVGTFVPASLREWFRHRAARIADREDFEQDLVASEAASRARREERLTRLLEKKDTWIQQTLSKEIACLQEGQNRTNDLLAKIHTTLVEMRARDAA